jgi:hypothetical protein
MLRVFAAALLVLSTVVLAPVFAADSPIPDDKKVIQFDTKIGTVTFRHDNHAQLSFATCKSCHHTYEGEGPIKSCHECHKAKDEGDAPKAKSAFHLRCAGCHEYTIKEGLQDHAGPLKSKCKLCHIK